MILRRLFGRARAPGANIPQALWEATLAGLPFVAPRSSTELADLRELAARFLAAKRFHGAHGLEVTDAMALSVAVQACLPLARMGSSPAARLGWYDDFVTIVLHPGEMRARRERPDWDGVVHEWQEELLGEAMEGGPVTLAWSEVARAAENAALGLNVVVHEFCHKIDLRDGKADGCPPLPARFAGHTHARAAREHWLTVLDSAYQHHREAVIRAERFGADPPWLDAYGAHSPGEFFPVCCEAYFVNRPVFAAQFPALTVLFDAFFGPF